MKCQFCKSEDTFVIDTRWKIEIKTTRRRYECRACGKRFFTQEIYEEFYPYKHGLKRMKLRRSDMITDKCSRCPTKGTDDVFRTSYFNTDWICSTCQEIEEAHPEFENAKKMESKAVLNRNYNFVGIGLPKDWREHVEKERLKRVSEGDS